LELDYSVAKGMPFIRIKGGGESLPLANRRISRPLLVLQISSLIPSKRTAFTSVAFFPIMGIAGWCRPSREHGQMHGEQLLYDGFLAKLAQKL
jgi:hypothetical protein